MKHRRILLNLKIIIPCILLAAGLYSLASSAQKQVYLAKYDGVINPVAGEYIAEVIKNANKKDVTAVLIELDTPGGLDTSMRDIVKEIGSSNVPVIPPSASLSF